jgi:putative ABC transport system permease protein
MLGIIIGIASVILMVSVGEAAQSYLLSQVASFGSDFVAVAPGKGDDTRNSGPPNITTKQTLTLDDYKHLKALTWPKAVSADLIAQDLVTYGSENDLVQISGATPGDPIIFNETMAKGNYFTDDDVNSHSRVVVLGSKVADKLFGEENAVGKTVKISKQPFHVIGVMAPAGTRFFSDADSGVYVPVTAALDLYNKTKVNFIGVKAGDVPLQQAVELVRVELRASHNIDNPNDDLSKDDFQVTTQEDAVKSVAVIGTILQTLLGSIASISLIVAGVGIMNIMYVTVTERTREVGLRKAIGAHAHDILGQFLWEAIMLTAIAGAIGVILGISAAWLAIQAISTFQTGWTFVIPWSGAAIGFGVSAAIGIVFGYFPARRAAKLNPIEALRYE